MTYLSNGVIVGRISQKGMVLMSVQNALEDLLNSMTKDELIEALTDISLPFSNVQRGDLENYKFIQKIYHNRIGSKL